MTRLLPEQLKTRMMSTKKTKFALVGLGFVSTRHKQAIEVNNGEIVLTCDIDPSKNADFTDWIEMFRSDKFKEVDVVSICAPNYLHSVMIKEALVLDKRVLSEKPLTIFDDVEENENLDVVMQLRCNTKVEELKSSNFQGDIEICVKTYREQKYWDSWKGQPKKSGGLLYNMGVHYIDLLCHLLGEPIKIRNSHYNGRNFAYGEIQFEKGTGKYHIEITNEPIEVVRKIKINGEEMDLEGATIPLNDSGQIVNLHTEVYRKFLAGERVGVKEARKSIKLIEQLYANSMQ